MFHSVWIRQIEQFLFAISIPFVCLSCAASLANCGIEKTASSSTSSCWYSDSRVHDNVIKVFVPLSCLLSTPRFLFISLPCLGVSIWPLEFVTLVSTFAFQPFAASLGHLFDPIFRFFAIFFRFLGRLQLFRVISCFQINIHWKQNNALKASFREINFNFCTFLARCEIASSHNKRYRLLSASSSRFSDNKFSIFYVFINGRKGRARQRNSNYFSLHNRCPVERCSSSLESTPKFKLNLDSLRKQLFLQFEQSGSSNL